MFRNLAQQKECRIEEGHLLGDHVHMLISIPPKYAVAQVAGFMKGKSAIHLARNFGGRQRNFTGCHFWTRGYYVSTAGRDEEIIRGYVKKLLLNAKVVRFLSAKHPDIFSEFEVVA